MGLARLVPATQSYIQSGGNGGWRRVGQGWGSRHHARRPATLTSPLRHPLCSRGGHLAVGCAGAAAGAALHSQGRHLCVRSPAVGGGHLAAARGGSALPAWPLSATQLRPHPLPPFAAADLHRADSREGPHARRHVSGCPCAAGGAGRGPGGAGPARRAARAAARAHRWGTHRLPAHLPPSVAPRPSPVVRRVPQEAPQEVADLIAACMSAAPEQRPSAEAIIHRLTPLLAAPGSTSPRESGQLAGAKGSGEKVSGEPRSPLGPR